MSLKKEMIAVEAQKIREALVREHGNIHRTAVLLDIPKTRLRWKLENRHPKLLKEAMRLRRRNGNARGRPRKVSASRSKKVVAKAWRASDYVFSDCAEALGIPASTCRDLIIRYDLPHKKKRASE